MYTYKAHRYQAQIEDQFPTLDEAIKRARSDHAQDGAWPTEIADESGMLVVCESDMDELLDRHI